MLEARLIITCVKSRAVSGFDVALAGDNPAVAMIPTAAPVAITDLVNLINLSMLYISTLAQKYQTKKQASLLFL